MAETHGKIRTALTYVAQLALGKLASFLARPMGPRTARGGGLTETRGMVVIFEMDTVWIDTMYPGIDPDEGWEKNLERVVNYDYLLKEYLDWQLKHLTVDNMDPVDWSRVEAEIISMAAGQIDLTAYYTKDEVDNIAQLILTSAEEYASAELSAKIGDIGSATVKAYAENYADDKIAGLSLSAKTVGGTAQLVLQSGGSPISGSGAALSMSVSNSNNGYSIISLTSGNIELASSDKITLGGNVVFASGSGSAKNLSYTTISGGTVTTNTITALNIEADSIKANSVIAGPLIYGGIFYATQGSNSDYFRVTSDGWDLYTGGTERASLKQSTNILTFSLGNTTPGKVVKYYGVVSAFSTSSRNYLWIGGQAYPWLGGTPVGLLIDLDDQKYKLYGTAVS